MNQTITTSLIKYRLKWLLLLCFFSLQAHSVQEKHVHGHGHGRLLIAQNNTTWQLQFELPATDLLGFEHEAETTQEHQRSESVRAKVENWQNVFHVNGSCNTTSESIQFPLESNDSHEEHEKEHHPHTHQDITLTYELACDESVSMLTLTLFDIAPSLEEIDVQWVSDSGQGMATVSPSNNSFSL